MCTVCSSGWKERAASGLLNGASEAELAPREGHFGISHTSHTWLWEPQWGGDSIMALQC